MFERLFSGLQQRNLINCMNIIIMSDHGMSNANCSRSIDLRNYMNVNDSEINTGAVGIVTPHGGRNETAVKEIVSQLSCKNPHMRVYLKEQLPVRTHYSDNPRINPIFLHMDPGWTVVDHDVVPNEFVCTGGKHGYDYLFPEMRAFFIALGPAFKKNYTVRPFMSIELYEMFAELIGVTPNPNNGTRGSMHHIMTNPKTLPPHLEPEPPAVAFEPNNTDEQGERLSASECHCYKSEQQMVRHYNIPMIRNMHLPFGIPSSAKENSSLHLLYNDNYVTAYNWKYKIPSWSSFTLEKPKKIYTKEDLCWHGDSRIPVNDSVKCSYYKNITDYNENIILHPLYPPGIYNTSDFNQATFLTNAVLKSASHSSLIEKPFYEMLNTWISQTGPLNVVMGPAFDIFSKGIRPDDNELDRLLYKMNISVLIPTHIFAVATWCTVKVDSLSNCDSSNLQAQGFILPNEPYPENCETAEGVITMNVARIVDIESLNGFSFFTKLPIYDAIRLRTAVPERPFKNLTGTLLPEHHY